MESLLLSINSVIVENQGVGVRFVNFKEVSNIDIVEWIILLVKVFDLWQNLSFVRICICLGE